MTDNKTKQIIDAHNKAVNERAAKKLAEKFLESLK